MKNLNLRSDVVQEIIEAQPRWIIRSGSLMFLVTLVIVITVASIVPYSRKKIYDVKIRFTNDNERVIINPTNTTLNGQLVENDQYIKKGSVLLVFEDEARLNKSKQFYSLLDSISHSLQGSSHPATTEMIQSAQSLIKSYFMPSIYGRDSLLFEKNLAYKVFTGSDLEDFIFHINVLSFQVENWIQNSQLIARSTGNIHYSIALDKNDKIQAEQEIGVIRTGTEKYRGQLLVPVADIDKIKIAQRVLIKVHAYSNDYGELVGKVSSINQLPNKDNSYVVNVEFENEAILTSKKIDLPYSSWKDLRGEIIIENSSALKQFLEFVHLSS